MDVVIPNIKVLKPTYCSMLGIFTSIRYDYTYLTKCKVEHELKMHGVPLGFVNFSNVRI